MKNFFPRLLKSFKYAFNGIRYCFRVEENLTAMTITGFIVVFGGIYFKISRIEWVVCIVLITAVLALEVFNTGIEYFLDLFHPELNENVGKIKDLLAGGVAIVSIGSGIVGFMIFLPKIINLF